MKNNKITVTSPLLPNIDEFREALTEIWDSKWITNNGLVHKRLEDELARYLNVPYISLFANGTLPLLTAFKLLNLTGEVITTPYSAVATSHSLWWSGLQPVFVDVDPDTCNIDPAKIEAAITPRTTAILPVHCYGTPCDMEAIQDIADRHGLKVIYDAAHAFGVTKKDKSILLAGDMSAISFHATKVYNTIEGGALILPDAETKRRADYLKNFGFADETTVVAPGINSKMDEIRAAYGLLNLKQIDSAIEQRKKVVEIYRHHFSQVPGVRCLPQLPSVVNNYAYFPIFIDSKIFGKSRDQLYHEMIDEDIWGRRYFYPLISDFQPYSSHPSAAPKRLPVARKLSDNVICLPLHHALSHNDINRILAFFPIKQ